MSKDKVAAISISTDLIANVRSLYSFSLNELSESSIIEGINGHSDFAYSAYVVSLAAYEAFLNETFLSTQVTAAISRKYKTQVSIKWLERLDLMRKTDLLPILLIGEGLDKGKQPLQDLSLLIKIRNLCVHYRYSHSKPKFIKPLEDRNIIIKPPEDKSQPDYPWPSHLATTEGIRWANNTVCYAVRAIYNLIKTHKNHEIHISDHMVSDFRTISEEEARFKLQIRGRIE